MSSIAIRDMEPADEYYVGTCTHTNESDEFDACARRRLAWFRGMYDDGLRVKVALYEGDRVAFLHVMPIEICPWGPLGRDLMAIPCLGVEEKVERKGVGRALIDAAEQEAKSQGKKGLVTVAYYWDFWLMPAPFFERCGFSIARRRREPAGERFEAHEEAIMWRLLDASAEAPQFLNRHYHFTPVPGVVVVDLFYSAFCVTGDIEAHRVREVVSEFGDAVMLREYSADDRAILTRHQMPRGIFVNGKEMWWGHPAPRDGIREAIARALRGA